MKKILLSTIIVGLGMLTATASPSKRTASYIKDHSATLIGEEVTVDVAWIDKARRISNEERVVILAHTWDEREKVRGGTVAVVMPAKDLEAFLKRHNTNPDREARDLDTNRLKGKLVELPKSKILLIDMSDGTLDLTDIKIPDIDGAGAIGLRKGGGKLGKGRILRKGARN